MNNIRHFIKGNETVSLPENNNTLSITVDFTQSQAIEFDFDSQKWMGEDAETILNERSNGLGSFVGIPYKMEVDGQMLPELMFDLRNFEKFGCNEVNVGVKLVQNKDWFINTASVLQIARLEADGKFLPSDYINVPYNINYIPDGMQLLMLSISTYLMTKELITATKEIADTIATATSAAAGLSPGLAALAALKVIIQVAFLAASVIAVINLIKAIGEQLYSRTRYHTSLKLASIFRVALAEMGLTFKSSIFDITKYANECLMATKTEKGSLNAGTLSKAAPLINSDNDIYYFAGFLDLMMRRFNGDFRIVNGEFRFERWDWWASTSSYVVPDNFANQDRRISQMTDNADDFKGGYCVSYVFDEKDQNTFNEISGMTYDVITVVASGLVGYENAHGSEYVELNVARASRKGTLTKFEIALKSLFQVADSIVNFMGGNSNLAGAISSRINNMELSDHFTSKAKIIRMNGSGLSATQVSAIEDWEEWHFINSFKQINGKHNQWVKYKIPCKFCAKDLLTLLSNNFATLTTGEDVEVERLTWTPYQDEATLEIRVNELYTTNLIHQFLTPSNGAN